jgi:hypothetical protein
LQKVTATLDLELPETGLARPATMRRERRSSLPPTTQLLSEGGDTRILVDPERLVNKYDRSPQPDPTVAAYGSSTASTISEPAFAAADRLRDRLVWAETREPPSLTYARELNRIRASFFDLCNLSDLPDLAMVFAASGTDIHMFAAQLLAGTESAPSLAIMVEAAETGRSVGAALAGTHISARAALGDSVVEGSPIAGRGAISVAAVPSRTFDGTPRSFAAVDAEVDALATAAAAAGRHVLLILVDVSKTGLIAPSPACVLALQRRFPEAVDVMVDACQFRLAPGTLRAYLEHGFMVAVTGSKFLSGPAFSGALLVPAAAAARLRKRPLPDGIAAYSARADWPIGWAAARALRDTPNCGLLLRWEAALEELRAFRAVADVDVTAILGGFSRAIQTRLAADPVFEPLAVPALQRRPLTEAPSWDGIPTIFPFLLRHALPGAKGSLFSRAETEQVYRLLSVDAAGQLGIGDRDPNRDLYALRCQVGQPVACGSREGVQLSALRICASTRLVVTAASGDHRRAPAVIQNALATLDKAALIAQALSKK